MRLQKGVSFATILVFLLSFISIVTIATAYYFIGKTRDNSFEENIMTLNTLQQLDAKWSENILKTRDYTLQDFDQLAHYMRKIREALKSFDQQGMADEKIVGKKTAIQYQIYKYSFTTKNEAVERYKSEQAILRNAVRYLPEAGKIAQQALTTQQSLESEETAALLMTSKLLINQYLLNTINKKEVKQKLVALELKNRSQTDNIKDKIQDYLIHANLIIKHKPKVDKMLEKAMSVDIAEASTNFINQYIGSQDIIKQEVKKWQQIMLIGVLILLVLLLWFLLGLRKSASKILLANTENKSIQQQLIKAKQHIKQVNRNILKAEQQSASGQLSLNTFKHINTAMPALATHIVFLKKIKANQALSQYKEKMSLLIKDMDHLYNDIYELGIIIDPQENKEQHVSFNFNHIVQSAFETVSSSVDSSISFNKQLSAVPDIQASSIDLYQITTKLLHQSAITWRQGNESIFIKTWATGHYANLCISIIGYDNLESLYAEEALSDLEKLLERNSAILKLTPRKNGKSSIIWVSFPYGQ